MDYYMQGIDDLLDNNTLSFYYADDGHFVFDIRHKQLHNREQVIYGSHLNDVICKLKQSTTPNHYGAIDKFLLQEDEGVRPYITVSKNENFVSSQVLFDDNELCAIHFRQTFFSAMTLTNLILDQANFDLSKY